MASINCRYGETFPATHSHSSVAEVRVCQHQPAKAAAVATKPTAKVTVPSSKYALSRPDGQGLEMFKVTSPSKGKWVGYTFTVRLIGAPGVWREIKISRAQQAEALLRIQAATYTDIDLTTGLVRHLSGPEAASVRYAREHKRCSVCDSPLSDPISQARGIGPICAGRF